MSTQIPTSWIQLVVQRISRKKEEHTAVFETVCEWNGHHITLEPDPSTCADVAGPFVSSVTADLKVGDQLQAKGLLVVNLHDQHNFSVLKLCLHVHEIRTGSKQSDKQSGDFNRPTGNKSSGDGSASDRSSSDGSSSDGFSSDRSSNNRFSKKRSVIKRAELEQETQTRSASDCDKSNEGELGEEIICDLQIPRSQLPSAKRQLPSKDGRDLYYFDGDSDHDDGNHDASADGGSLTLVPFTGSLRALAGLAGSTSRSSGYSIPGRGDYAQDAYFSFNGRGQPTVFGVTLRRLHEHNLGYSFNQMFSDGSKRVIVLSTQMEEDESIDTLVVTESVYYPHGLLAWSRRL